MPELRRNPITGQWVIIAPERGGRPHELARPGRRAAALAHVKTCPFCPGNETMTPPAITEVPGGGSDARWQLRVFPNRYPALSPEAATLDLASSPLFEAVPGVGAHEVIVETPVHNRFPVDRTDEEMLLLVTAYRQRCAELMSRASVRYVLIFKNHGEEAGTSLEHPHSQVIAAPLVPENMRRSHEIAREHHERTGRCLLCDVAEEESRAASRVVFRDDKFVVFHPFAAARPAETWVIPLAHQAALHQLSDESAMAFARVLRRTLRQLSTGFGDPDFNFAVHSAAKPDADKPYLHWYLQLMPRLSKPAGFELGSGIFINTSPPELTAEQMRSAPA